MQQLVGRLRRASTTAADGFTREVSQQVADLIEQLVATDSAQLRAARTLAKEVRGAISIANRELRDALGNTNVNVLEHWANEVLSPSSDVQQPGE